MTADMLDEGSGDRSAIEMQEELARIGAELDTETGPDSVVLAIPLLERFVPQGLRILSDIVVRPRLGAADFDRVRTLRANRIRQLKDLPGVNAEAVFTRALYGAHPYGHLSIGSSASLAGMSTGDVAAFHRTRYEPSRATLIAVGALDGASVARYAEEAFGDWRGEPSGQAAPGSRGRWRGRRTGPGCSRDAAADCRSARRRANRTPRRSSRRAAEDARLPRARPAQRRARRPLLEPAQPEPPRAQGLHLQRAVRVRLPQAGRPVRGADQRADGRHRRRRRRDPP